MEPDIKRLQRDNRDVIGENQRLKDKITDLDMEVSMVRTNFINLQNKH
jgi:hypothetical protein